MPEEHSHDINVVLSRGIEQRRMAMRIDSGSRRIVPFGDNLRDASLVTVVRSGPY